MTLSETLRLSHPICHQDISKMFGRYSSRAIHLINNKRCPCLYYWMQRWQKIANEWLTPGRKICGPYDGTDSVKKTTMFVVHPFAAIFLEKRFYEKMKFSSCQESCRKALKAFSSFFYLLDKAAFSCTKILNAVQGYIHWQLISCKHTASLRMFVIFQTCTVFWSSSGILSNL